MDSLSDNSIMEQLLSNNFLDNQQSHQTLQQQQQPQHQQQYNQNDMKIDTEMFDSNDLLMSNPENNTMFLDNDFNFEKFFNLNSVIDNEQVTKQVQQPLKTPTFKLTRQQQLRLQQQDFTGDELKLINSNNTLVSSLQAPPSPYTPDIRKSMEEDNEKFLTNLDWDFRMEQAGNTTSYFGDSTTLISEPKTSNEFVDNFESIDENEVTNYRARITNSISSSFSNIFKSSNGSSTSNRFNLRVINPLSTHKDPSALVQTLPNLVENVENLSIDHADDESSFDENKKRKCTKKTHPKNCDCTTTHATAPTIPKKKRSTTTSFVNVLTNARLGFNSNKNLQKEKSKTLFFDDFDNDSFNDESIHLRLSEDIPIPLDFDEELTKVISLASKNNSTYNFNSDLHSINISINPSINQSITPSINHSLHNSFQPTNNEDTVSAIERDIQIKIEEPELSKESTNDNDANVDSTTKDENSPDYAALFSDVPTKKKTKTLSFRKMTLSQPKSNSSLIEEDKKEEINESEEPEVIIPLKDSTRGRKPSLEYDASKPFVCTYCPRRFKRQEHLKRHFRSLHTNQKPFDCPLCPKKFSRSDNLAQHIKTHNEGDIQMETIDG